MAAAAIEKPAPAPSSESKSARKKKAKAEAEAVTANGTAQTPTGFTATTKEDSSNGAAEGEPSTEHPHIQELQKQIKSIQKKLKSMGKTDTAIAENPGLSLDQLVAQRKINPDQKASAIKKPGLQAQLVQLEEQITQYQKFDADYKKLLLRQKEDLAAQHKLELEKVKEELQADGTTAGVTELRKNLLLFSQFLRAAAAKRQNDDQTTVESQAFEGALLLVYGGDQKAVDTAINIIEASDEQVTNIEGEKLQVKYSFIKQASIDHAPYQAEEEWVDQVAEAGAAEEAPNGEAISSSVPVSDPTIVNAGLTELESQSNGIEAAAEATAVAQASAGEEGGNLAGDSWDPSTTDTDKNGLDESYEVIPRGSDEVDISASAAPAAHDKIASWADDAAQEAATVSGNQAGEGWDTKAAGESAQDKSWASAPVTNGSAGPRTPADDGFQEIQRHNTRGRGRGRGSFRGDGEGRGRGGGRGGFRGGRRGDGEARGGRGGGRARGGPRGGTAPAAPAA